MSISASLAEQGFNNLRMQTRRFANMRNLSTRRDGILEMFDPGTDRFLHSVGTLGAELQNSLRPAS